MTTGIYLRKPFSEEHRRNMSIARMGFLVSEESKQKNREKHLGKKQSEDTKNKISNTLKGKLNHLITEETGKKISKANKGKKAWNKGLTKEIDERVLKYSSSIAISNTGKIQSKDLIAKRVASIKKNSERWKQNLRISAINYIKTTCGGIRPQMGKYEKQILDEIQKRIGFSIKRGFYINGYYLDGYCQEINLAIEIDEEYHYKNNRLNKKDIEKQKNIISALNCNFMRVRVKDVLQNKILNKEILYNCIGGEVWEKELLF